MIALINDSSEQDCLVCSDMYGVPCNKYLCVYTKTLAMSLSLSLSLLIYDL